VEARKTNIIWLLKAWTYIDPGALSTQVSKKHSYRLMQQTWHGRHSTPPTNSFQNQI